jgi:hypothetical protein
MYVEMCVYTYTSVYLLLYTSVYLHKLWKNDKEINVLKYYWTKLIVN